MNTASACHFVKAACGYLLLSLAFAGVASAKDTAAVGYTTMIIGSAYRDSDGHQTPLGRGDKVRVGDTIVTRNNGHVHIKFNDQGIISVRPNSELTIEKYQYNAQSPELSTVKFNLVKGVTRSISGNAAKAARARFRMNTPIAAIGVRGTDFVVSANSTEIKAFVNEGIIVVSPFSDLCSASTLGPCSANAVELHGNTNQLLELHSQQALATIRLVGNEALPALLYQSKSNDAAPANKSDEVDSDKSSAEKSETAPEENIEENQESLNLDSEKIGQQNRVVSDNSATSEPDSLNLVLDNSSTVEPDSLNLDTDDINLSKPELTKDLSSVDSFSYVVPDAPIDSQILTERQLVWGRWNIDSTDQLISTSYQAASEGRVISVSNETYGLFRQGDRQQSMATNLGKISFDLHFADVDYFSVSGSEQMVVNNAFLELDFNSGSFSTSLDLSSESATGVSFSAQGSISEDGFFNKTNGTAILGGAVSFDGTEAGYFFTKELDNGTVKGTTLWGKP